MDNQENTQEAPRKAPRKKSLLRTGAKILKYVFLFLFLTLTAATGFVVWVMGTESGQTWAVGKINTLLGPAPGKEGVTVRITALSGVLPFNFSLGVEVGDKNGIWLIAPENSLQLDWRKLPGEVRLNTLRLANIDLQRLPELPPAAPAAPSPPFGITDVKKIIQEANDFLRERHWWLPKIYLDNILLENALLPAELVPQKESGARIKANLSLNGALADGQFKAKLDASAANANGAPIDFGTASIGESKASVNLDCGIVEQGLKAAAQLDLAATQPILALQDIPADVLGEESTVSLKLAAFAENDNRKWNINLSGPDIRAGLIDLKTDGDWHTGSGLKENYIDGPAALNVFAKILPVHADNPRSPLNMLKAPVQLNINAKGDLPKISLTAHLDGEEFKVDKYPLTKLAASLESEEIDLPLSAAGWDALANENTLKMALSALVDKYPVKIDGSLFFQALKEKEEEKGWRAGIRGLKLQALETDCTGNLAAVLLPGQKPALDGEILAKINNWKSIEPFLAGNRISGSLSLDVRMNSGLPNNPAEKIAPEKLVFGTGRQAAAIKLEAANLEARLAGGGKPYGIGSLDLDAEATDIFADLALRAALAASRIRAEGMSFNTEAKVSGPLNGPLNADLRVNGDITTSLSAVWKRGDVLLKELNFRMNPAKFLAGAKKGAVLGIAASRPASIQYGEQGLKIQNLDIAITPSGRLQAKGGLASDKLDLSLALEDFALKPWQALVPAIPSGSAAVRLNLAGSPQRPGGNFRASLREIKIPRAPLAPISLNIDGSLKHGSNGSVFGVNLEIDKSTLNTLGAKTASVSASIPLLFADNGIPTLNMQGNLAGRVRWDGALGPIWNLVPVADQRLNGRLSINLDASGSLAKPKLRGGLNIDQARYENVLLGVLLTDIFLKVNLTDRGPVQKVGNADLPGGITLKAGLSDGFKGTVKIDGKADLDGKNLDLKLAMDRLKPLRRRDIHVELSGNATVTGEAVAPDVKGAFVVNRGEILLDNLSMTGSVTTLDITKVSQEKTVAKPTAPTPVGSLDVRLRILPRFRVDGRGLGSVWQANLLAQGPLNNPQITGTINAVSGNFDFLGKIFELTKGTVTFAGGSISNPLLDIELTNETPDLTAHIIVTGPVNKMRLVLTSDPSVPRDEILSRVLFGKSINDLSRLEALQLAAAVAQLAGFGGGNGIMNFTKKALGIDVLRIGTSSSGSASEEDSGAGGTTIEAGKYITDRLYMGVQQGMKEDSTAFIIQFELTPRTSLEIMSESNNTWGGLNWKYNY